MSGMSAHRRILTALALSAAVALSALVLRSAVAMPPGSFVPPSFITHSAMLVCTLALAWLFSKGKLAEFGFTLGTYRWSPRILLWVLPMAALSTLGAFVAPEGGGGGGPAEGLSRVQLVLFVWIYASVCEEVLTRGLLQTLLAAWPGRTREQRVAPPDAAEQAVGRRFWSMPVVVSALFFGAMHLVLVRSMGARAAPLIVLTILLGFLAARYRERTGSLIPAIIVHALFNVGAMLPVWIVQAVRG